eukprot:1297339-Rhodomonas_salina.1
MEWRDLRGSDLKKRLAALEHAKLLRGTRKLAKHKPRPADVMDMLLAQRVQQERDARHEVRGRCCAAAASGLGGAGSGL